MNQFAVLTLSLGLGVAGLSAQAKSVAPAAATKPAPSLLDARKGFVTKLRKPVRDEDRLVTPPEAVFSVVRYKTSIGEMRAYLSPPPIKGQKHPAMLWLTGGFPPGGGGPSLWEDEDPANAQSARAYREAGMIMMFPTLRGSYGNPGSQESLFGEVDDVLAALEYLARVDHVDATRIYLGGHSTGGTLAMLVAACTDRPRAVFALGPIANPADYGQDDLNYDAKSTQENRLRSPIAFLAAMRSPTFVLEGERGNLPSLQAMEKANTNPGVHFLTLRGVDHFSILTPANSMIAGLLAKQETSTPVTLDAAALQSRCDQFGVAMREADDLESLARARRAERDFTAPRRVDFFLSATSKEAITNAGRALLPAGFAAEPVMPRKDDRGRTWYSLTIHRQLDLTALAAVFAASRTVAAAGAEHGAAYRGWDVPSSQ